jgi:multiple sugar transport system substrate-binding protein
VKLMRLSAGLLAVLALFFVVACGSDSNDKKTGDAKKVEAAAAKPKGTINVCIGKDTSGIHTKLVKQFNKENPGAKAKLVELPESADEQRTQMIQRLRAKSSECDLLALDVVWTAEFAAQGWLRDATDIVEKRKSEFIPSTLETVKYEDKYWAMPYNTNAGFLYYRTDQVKDAPTTWEDVYKQGGEKDGVVYQGAQYEGLTVNFLELLYSAGGKVLSDDGKTAEVDSPEAKKVLTFMADGIKNGDVPKAVTTYKEEEARRAFESGKATFERQWPYAYSLGQKASKIKGKFDITTFPGFGGKEGAGVVGGYNLALSAYSKNAESATALINFLTGKEAQIEAAKVATPPVLVAAYDDPEVQKAMPFATKLRDAIDQAQARPVSPVYTQISEAIYKNVHNALTGDSSPDEALKKMKSDIEKAQQTF